MIGYTQNNLYDELFSFSNETDWRRLQSSKEELVSSPPIDYSEATIVGRVKGIAMSSFQYLLIFYPLVYFAGKTVRRAVSWLMPQSLKNRALQQVVQKETIFSAIRFAVHPVFPYLRYVDRIACCVLLALSARYVLQRLAMMAFYPAQSRILRSIISKLSISYLDQQRDFVGNAKDRTKKAKTEWEQAQCEPIDVITGFSYKPQRDSVRTHWNSVRKN